MVLSLSTSYWPWSAFYTGDSPHPLTNYILLLTSKTTHFLLFSTCLSGHSFSVTCTESFFSQWLRHKATSLPSVHSSLDELGHPHGFSLNSLHNLQSPVIYSLSPSLSSFYVVSFYLLCFNYTVFLSVSWRGAFLPQRLCLWCSLFLKHSASCSDDWLLKFHVSPKMPLLRGLPRTFLPRPSYTIIPPC